MVGAERSLLGGRSGAANAEKIQTASLNNLRLLDMETAARILSVAVGGALGAAARYLINVSPLQNYLKPFPFPTFFINVTGSFLIGFLLILLAGKFQANENLRFAVVVGFLGAYTTFSTFEMEVFALISENRFVTAFAYLFSSILVGFVGVSLGVWFARQF